ncbi:MAG: ABC transporter ATP-binding protein [Deltaproteobacteria bacterium]|nr:ABC transporter ATP-binding protein [Deltaproteobacteria bacterium]
MKADIIARNLSKTFNNGLTTLKNLNFEITEGDFVSLVGPSGCGKSTLLRLIAKLEMPSEGSLQVYHDQIAFVFQDAHLLPWRNVFENISLPLELQKISPAEKKSLTEQALEKIGLKDFASAYPAQLSGGMKMRVSLARALVTQPKLLLMDEPFAALDEVSRASLEEDLRKLWLEKKMTIVFVTHSISEACFLTNRALVLSSRPGQIVLDKKISLPENRKLEITLSPEFSKTAREILEVLSANTQQDMAAQL